MRHPNWRTPLVRHPQVEPIEARLLMTADSLGDFFLDDIVEEQAGASDAISVVGAYDFTGLESARAGYGFTGAGQTVAIIDSGIAYDHAALGGGFGTSYRVVGGWDFSEENDGNPYDDGPGGSHGTHVAGIVGSTDATSPGVAPGVDLVALRVFNDSGSGTFGWVEKALKWVHDNRNAFRNPITTVNLSIGSTWNSTSIPSWSTLEDEFAQLESDGIFISVAAGNSFATYNTPGLSYPAASSSVVPVSSVDAGGGLSNFSQRHDRAIAAPGRSIRSTVPDYVGNLNRKTDDFLWFSGTSMAAPFVAGASVLLRQAMQFVGTTNITQDAIYGIMRSTADSIYDSVTNATYLRLNLGRALDSVMPADEYGSTVQTAHNLSNLSTRTIAGTIGRLDDRDYFTFTAAETGHAEFSASVTGQMRAVWESVGASGTTSPDGTFSFDVVAGRSYTVAIATSGGMGGYTIDASITPTVTQLGSLDSHTLAGLQLGGGEHWYSFTAARAGIMTAEALFANAAGNLDIALYDANYQLLSGSATDGNLERTDVTAAAGQQFYLCVRGASPQATLKFTNLVSQSGSQLNVAGTSGDDTIELVAGDTVLLKVNGTSYSFAANAAQNLNIAGSGGTDTLVVSGTAGSEQAVLRIGVAELTGQNYALRAEGFELVTFYGGAGQDTAVLYDGAGDDAFLGDPFIAKMSGTGYTNTALGFEVVQAYASTGQNSAILYDSTGDDFLVADPKSARLWGAGFSVAASGFATVDARAQFGGRDEAYLYDSAGSDVLIARPESSTLTGASYNNIARLFEQVDASALQGGRDKAYLYDSAGNDVLIARPNVTTISGAGFYNIARQFDYVDAQASKGGRDEAYLYDSAGNDILIAKPSIATMYGSTYYNVARYFDYVDAGAFEGGRDEAYLYDSAGDDYLTITPEMVQLWGSGFSNVARQFDYVDSRASAGGYDAAWLYDSLGDDLIVAKAWSSAFSYADGRYGVARSFESVTATSTAGNDEAALYDSVGDDRLTIAGQTATMIGLQFTVSAQGFRSVKGHGSSGINVLDRQATDCLFQALGAWQ